LAYQLLWQAFRFLVQPGADMKGFSFQNQQVGLVRNAVCKIQPHTLDRRGPQLNRQGVIVAGWSLVAKTTFDDGENCIAFLPLQETCAEFTKKRAAGRLEQVEVARVINVVADGALGVGDSMQVTKGRSSHGRSVGMCAESAKPKRWAIFASGFAKVVAKFPIAQRRIEIMLPPMDWQQIVSLIIVGVVAVALGWGGIRRRKFSFARATHCGCSTVNRSSPGSSIVFHARKGERPQVLMKMK